MVLRNVNEKYMRLGEWKKNYETTRLLKTLCLPTEKGMYVNVLNCEGFLLMKMTNGIGGTYYIQLSFQWGFHWKCIYVTYIHWGLPKLFFLIEACSL